MKKIAVLIILSLFVLSFRIWAKDYKIGPEDVIEVGVWKEPDLSRTVIVRPDGKISLPLIGDVQAKGLTPIQLRDEIQKKFKAFLSNPVVFIILTEVNSPKIYILGKVKSPGMYPLKSDLTLLQAIALAGGFAEWAKKDKVIILRKEKEKDVRLVINIEKLIKKRGEEKDVELKNGDRIIIP